MGALFKGESFIRILTPPTRKVTSAVDSLAMRSARRCFKFGYGFMFSGRRDAKTVWVQQKRDASVTARTDFFYMGTNMRMATHRTIFAKSGFLLAELCPERKKHGPETMRSVRHRSVSTIQ